MESRFYLLDLLIWLQILNSTSTFLIADQECCATRRSCLENQILILSNCLLTDKSFKNISNNNFKMLNISNINFRASKIKAFEKFENISQLFIQDMNSQFIENIIQVVPNLIELYITESELEKIKNIIFLKLNNLKILNLYKNDIKTVELNTFAKLFKLEQLSLKYNALVSIDKGAFSNIKKLKFIDLSENTLLVLNQNIFSNNIALHTIILRNTNTTNLDTNFFENLNVLKILDCRSAKLAKLLFKNLRNLIELNLAHNNIEKISNSTFKNLISVQQIFLQHKKIIAVESHAFNKLINLVEINLSWNQINTISFTNWGFFKKIDLSHNVIEEMDEFNFSGRLIKINLNFNQIKNLEINSIRSEVDSVVEMELQNNLITKIDFNGANLTATNMTININVEKNNITCDCHIYDLVIYERSFSSPYSIKYDPCSENAESLNCSMKDLMNVEGCFQKCICILRQHDQRMFIDCSNQALKELPNQLELQLAPLFSSIAHIEMNLEGNSIKNLQKSDCPIYNNVTKLFLQNNGLKTIEWLPENLQVLHLHGNQLEFFPEKLFPKSIKELTIYNNPWICSCQLHNFIKENYQQFSNLSLTFCANSSQVLIIDVEDLCYSHQTIIIGVIASTSIFLGIVFVYIALCSKNRYWSKNNFDEDKMFDVFISYSDKDEDFVGDVLLPGLEAAPWKICIDVRDWTLGESIPAEVIKSIHTSRWTLIVLSDNFVGSDRGKIEFDLAISEARVIVVIYNLNFDKLEGDFKDYVKKHTYIKWPDQHFWKKLNSTILAK